MLPSRSLISSLFINILNPLSLTQTLALPSIQSATSTFYTQSRSTLPADTSLASYFLSTESALAAEQERLTNVFHLSNDAGGIVNLVEKELLVEDSKSLIEKGLKELMVGGRKKDIEMKEGAEGAEDEGDEEDAQNVKVVGTEPDMDGLERMMRLLRRVGQAGGVKAVWGAWVQVCTRLHEYPHAVTD